MALEWIKSILGDSYTEEMEKKISAEIGKAFVAKADFNALNDGKKALESQLAEANKEIKSYKDMDIEGIKKAAADWETKATAAQQEAKEREAAVRFDAALDLALVKSKARNPKAVKALLDVEKLKGSQNREADIEAELEAVKKENDYLFDSGETPPPYAAGAGTAAPDGTWESTLRSAAGLPTNK